MNPTDSNPFGLALLAGRLVGTVTGSDGHITIRATCKARPSAPGARWPNATFADCELVDLAVPGADGEWADKIATWYPAHSSNKWAGRFFVDRAQTDERRVKAARYLLDVAAGEKAGTHVLLSDRCLRCSREITHPDSIGTGFGPECIKHVAPFMQNRSGTDAAAHLPKDKSAPRPTENVEPDLSELTDAELDRAQVKTLERLQRNDNEGDRRRSDLIAAERGRRNRERDQADGTAPRDTHTAFMPPKPKTENFEPAIISEGLTFRLRLGDDPTQVLSTDNAGA